MGARREAFAWALSVCLWVSPNLLGCDLDAEGRVASSPAVQPANASSAPVLASSAVAESSATRRNPDAEAPDSAMYEPGAAQAAVDQIAKRLGGDVRALDVSIFPDHVRIQAQSVQDRTQVDGWEVRLDEVFGPVPVRLSGAGYLEQNLFSVSAVDLDKLPEVLRQAKERLREIPQAKVNYVSVDRDLPFSRQVMFRVFVQGDGERGYADFDAKGRYVRSAKGTPK